MKVFLPNSANLQNIEGFFRKYSSKNNKRLRFSMHKRYVHMHPAALAMAACLGEFAKHEKIPIKGEVANVRSLPYLIRMNLFDFIRLDPGKSIEEHEESGRFIPLTQIKNNDELRQVIVSIIPLLHAPPEVADPIKYVLSEMVRNVLEHANSPLGAFICAQYYRNQEKISIGIADAGVGIRQSITRSHRAQTAEDAIMLALQPGITGVTKKVGGNEFNAGAGLFFTKSIASLSRNYFIIYSDDCLFKLLKRPETERPILHANPNSDYHKITDGLPRWRGTIVGIDIAVEPGSEFSEFLSTIRKAYSIDVKKKKVEYFRKIRFES